MALRSHVRKTDNSKLGRSVLTDRKIQSSRYKVEEVVVPDPSPVSEKKSSSVKKKKK
ncbi:MAG: hypothetical protein H8D80_01310 [Proteobacteria bacterium]|nr:hypothetical protein [Pseudomonadota bacterium]